LKTSVERFINSENIKNFKKRLEASTDGAQRETLQRLLAEEEARAAQLAKRAEDYKTTRNR
jgi:hypothetical protein